MSIKAEITGAAAALSASAGSGGSVPAGWSLWKDEYVYKPLQKVSRNGSGYVCLRENTNTDPEADVNAGDGVEGSCWLLIVKKGERGLPGEAVSLAVKEAAEQARDDARYSAELAANAWKAAETEKYSAEKAKEEAEAAQGAAEEAAQDAAAKAVAAAQNLMEQHVSASQEAASYAAGAANAAAGSAAAAANSQTAAAESAADAANSETAAAESAADAANSETAAKASETAAKTAETNAAGSASGAAGSADAAQKAAQAASQKAEDAGSSAASADQAKTAAQAAQAAAEKARDDAQGIAGGNFATKADVQSAKEAANTYTDKQIASIPTPDVSGQIGAHNESEDAHGDIRSLISGLSNRLNALADSDDTTLDQLSEIVAYIKSNRTLIESITTAKVSVSDIVNDLTTGGAKKPLSAEQGKALKALADAAAAAASAAQTAAKTAQTTADGKAADSHNQAASTITAGTFSGQVAAKAGAQEPGTKLLRNIKLMDAADYDAVTDWTTVISEGEVAFRCEEVS